MLVMGSLKSIVNILFLRMRDIVDLDKLEAGLSFNNFKQIVMKELNKIGYTGDKKEMCMLGWVLYAW